MIHPVRACMWVIRRILRYGLVTRKFNDSFTVKMRRHEAATRTGRGYNGTMRRLQDSRPLMFRDVAEMLICGHSSVSCQLITRNTFPRSFPDSKKWTARFLYFSFGHVLWNFSE